MTDLNIRDNVAVQQSLATTLQDLDAIDAGVDREITRALQKEEQLYRKISKLHLSSIYSITTAAAFTIANLINLVSFPVAFTGCVAGITGTVISMVKINRVQAAIITNTQRTTERIFARVLQASSQQQ